MSGQGRTPRIRPVATFGGRRLAAAALLIAPIRFYRFS